MQISIAEKEGISICRVDGELDVNTAPQVKKIFEKLIKEKKDKIIINMETIYKR